MRERGLTFAFACLLSYVPRWPFPAACGHSQGVALPHRLSHAAGLFSPFTWLETIGGRYGPLRVIRPAGRDVEKHASLYTRGFLSLVERENKSRGGVNRSVVIVITIGNGAIRRPNALNGRDVARCNLVQW